MKWVYLFLCLFFALGISESNAVNSDIEDDSGVEVYIYVMVGVATLFVCICYMCCLMCFGICLYMCVRLSKKGNIVEDLNAVGGQRQEMLLSLRPGFEEKYSFMKPADFRLGKFYYTPEGKRIQLLDLEFKFRHRRVQFKGESERKFVDIYYNLRSGKYTPYSHCKYCFQEQHDFYKKYDSLCCCKCGLPVIRYIYFTSEERFCIICSLMNKYHPRPHIRCLLHPSGKGKKLGAMYVLYKEYFSISSASKPKKRSPKSDKLEVMLRNEVWKLNSALRFEYLWLVRGLVRKNLTSRHNTFESFRALKEARKEIVKRRNEIGPNMATNYQEHGLDINLRNNSLSEENKSRFFKSLNENLTNLLVKIDDHFKFLEARERCYASKTFEGKVGEKRKFEPTMVETEEGTSNTPDVQMSSPQQRVPPQHQQRRPPHLRRHPEQQDYNSPNQDYTPNQGRRDPHAEYQPRKKKIKVNNNPAVLKPVPMIKVPLGRDHRNQVNSNRNDRNNMNRISNSSTGSSVDMEQIEKHIDLTLKNPLFNSFSLPLDVPLTNQNDNSYLIPKGLQGKGTHSHFHQRVSGQIAPAVFEERMSERNDTRTRRRRKKKKVGVSMRQQQQQQPRMDEFMSNFRPPPIPLHLPSMGNPHHHPSMMRRSQRTNSNDGNYEDTTVPNLFQDQRYVRESSSETTTSEQSVTSTNSTNTKYRNMQNHSGYIPPPPVPNVMPSPSGETDNSLPPSPNSQVVMMEHYQRQQRASNKRHRGEYEDDEGENEEEVIIEEGDDVSNKEASATTNVFDPDSLFFPHMQSIQPPPSFLTFYDENGNYIHPPPPMTAPRTQMVLDPKLLEYTPPVNNSTPQSSFGSKGLSNPSLPSSTNDRNSSLGVRFSSTNDNDFDEHDMGSVPTNLSVMSNNTGSVDTSQSLLRENMVLEQNRFMSTGVDNKILKRNLQRRKRKMMMHQMRNQQQQQHHHHHHHNNIVPPPVKVDEAGSYDADEFIASFTYNEDDVDHVIGTIESPRNLENNFNNHSVMDMEHIPQELGSY